MRISEDKIDEVRNANDIVEVISGYVQLKKRGKNYLGLCPFHTEKTPSFTVSAEKQMYHCFGCGKGGNIFTFLMEMDKVSFVEAVKSLASKAGIIIPEENLPATEEQKEFENYYAICRFAGMHFFCNLTESEEGKEALQYFYKRGFSDETIRTFGLGYSMNSWDAFVIQAQAEGFKPEDIIKVGLARRRDDGSIYDYFRGRAMFPIFSATGRVIGFGARKMREDDAIAGKYINSPESPLYDKSRVLYGLFHSKEYIRQEDNALMVEGYADLISLYQAGIQNAVASSGTALTESQLKLIARHSQNLTLVYDADTAGSSATVRGIDLALEHNLDIRIIELPEGEDPDSFIQKHGGNEFRERLKNAVSFIDYKAKKFQISGAFATAEGKTQAVRSLVQSIAKMGDELKRNFYIKDVAEKYGVYESLLFRELERVLNRERHVTRSTGAKKPAEIKDKTNAVDARLNETQPIPPEEHDILKLILEGDPEVIRYLLSNISLEQISSERLRKLAGFILDLYDERGKIDATGIINEAQELEFKNLISDLMLSHYELSHGWQEMEKEIDEAEPMRIARDAVVAVHRKTIQKEREENLKMLEKAKIQGLEVKPYQQRAMELNEMLKQLTTNRT
ncbi:MAG: DNA primase [Bacteroidetes bacterium]|nr:DNA primase [Bacteroidota bacterium]